MERDTTEFIRERDIISDLSRELVSSTNDINAIHHKGSGSGNALGGLLMQPHKYMTCCLCGLVWNVPLQTKVKEGQYICPTCWLRQHRALQKSKEGRVKK